MIKTARLQGDCQIASRIWKETGRPAVIGIDDGEIESLIAIMRAEHPGTQFAAEWTHDGKAFRYDSAP